MPLLNYMLWSFLLLQGVGDRPHRQEVKIRCTVMLLSSTQWKLLLVLKAMTFRSYKALEHASLHSLSFKTMQFALVSTLLP